MSNYNTLKSAIQAAIKTNGNNEITGQILQDKLLSMISTLGFGYQFMGIANPNSYPGTPDAKIFYIAYEAGTYVYMGGIEVTGLCVLRYDTNWVKEDISVSGGGGTDFTVESSDLTLVSGDPQKLKFADRLRGSNINSGLNYVIVRDTASISSQLSAQNTIYEIRYEFDLSSGTVEIPANSILYFNGGKIKNGTITGSKTGIIAGNYTIFENITFSGSFTGTLNACWVGATPNNSAFDNSAIIQSWFGGYCDSFKCLSFPLGTYYFLTGASLTTDKRDLVLDGNDSLFYVNIPTDDAYFIKLQTGSSSSGENFRIQNIRIRNAKQTSGFNISKTRAILFDGTQRFSVSNVQIWYFDVAVELINVWYGGFYGQNLLSKNRIGILIRGVGYYEVNTIEVHNVDFKGVTRDVVAAIYPQNDGESETDYITRTACCGIDAYCLLQAFGCRGNIFETFDYAIRTNWYKRESNGLMVGGPLAITECYFEDNRQDDIYIGEGNVNAYGSGTATQRFRHIVNIANCRFFTRKHITLYGAECLLTSNQDVSVFVETSTYISTVLDYQGPVTIEGLVGATATVHRIGGRYTELYNKNGQNNAPATNYQKLQQTRSFGQVVSRLNGYSKDSTQSPSYNIRFKAWNFETEPKTRFVFDIQPLEYFRDGDNSYNRLLVPSGNGMAPVMCDGDYNFRALNTTGGIPLAEFIRRWKAGTSYTGTVSNLYPFQITADPTTGTVYNESGTLVGFGINALGTTITTSSANAYLPFIDALIWVRISGSRLKQYADILQCARTYGELRSSIDEITTYTAYLSCYGTNANMASVQKRINAVYYDTTNSKLMIYNGFEWVEMTSPYQRYYYKEYGNKLAERATMADLPGQTYINYATGIKYTFAFRPRNNYKWVPSIGAVDDLTHPNGYADDNTLDYANELSVGEMVMYNGALYKWDGTQLVAM